jgi:hypothetical protein
MSTLRELQRDFAAAMTSPDDASGAPAALELIRGGTDIARQRIAIHRNTMSSVLATALQLTYPAVAALVGPAFFDQAARAFATQHRPHAALLDLYGGEFPDFLAGYAPAQSLAYLPDVARLEWAVDQTSRAGTGDDGEIRVALPGVTLTLPSSLTVLAADYPAEAIRRAVLGGDEDAIAAIDPAASPGAAAIWGAQDGAATAALGPGAAAFLGALLRGLDAEAALAVAAAVDADPVAGITKEIFQSSFARLIPDQ